MHAIAGCAETVCGQAKRGVGAAHGGRLPVYRQGLDLVRAACTSPRVLVFSRLALAIAICISLTCSRRAPAVLSGQAAFAKLPVCRRRALTRAERASPPADTPPEHGRHRCVTIQSLLRISSRPRGSPEFASDWTHSREFLLPRYWFLPRTFEQKIRQRNPRVFIAHGSWGSWH